MICDQTGKVIFETKKKAVKVLEYLKNKGRPEKDYYYCKFCNGYHLSARPFKKKKS